MRLGECRNINRDPHTHHRDSEPSHVHDPGKYTREKVVFQAWLSTNALRSERAEGHHPGLAVELELSGRNAVLSH
jgi:hypothetical protein